MLTTRELQDEIIRLKKEKDICILAHAYQSHDIWEVADYVGDSYGLSVQAAKAAQSTVLMCGVRFMAETVKILSPQQKAGRGPRQNHFPDGRSAPRGALCQADPARLGCMGK